MKQLLRQFLKPYQARALIGILTKVIEVIFECITPLVIARMIDSGVAAQNVGEVVRLGLMLLVFALISYSFTLVCQKMAAVVSQGMGTDLRRALFERITSFAGPELARFGTPTLVTRTTNDVIQVQVAVALGIRQLTRWPLLAVGSVCACLMLDWHLGLVTLVCTPVVALIFWWVMSRVLPYYRKLQQALDQLARLVRETLTGVRPIRAFRQEARMAARFTQAATEQTNIAIASGKLASLLSPATMLVMDLGIVAILWQAGIRINAGTLSQGELMAYINYMTTSLISIGYLANLLVIFMRAGASATRIMEVLTTEPAICDPAPHPTQSTQPIQAARPVLRFKQVGFSYDGDPASAHPALTQVSFELGEGETLGIIGGTGSGKSTLAALIPRLFDPTTGSIDFLGSPLKSYPLHTLRQLVGYVPQQTSLMSGTLRQNLSWKAPDATVEELTLALTAAQAQDFVSKLPQGLDAPVEAGGKNFSGGQRQRLTLARALMGSPRLLVLDDAASALDFATDARLRQALAQLPWPHATILISQRVSSLMQADQILVLHHGQVCGLGTHAELLASCTLYQEICASQLSPEDLAHSAAHLSSAHPSGVNPTNASPSSDQTSPKEAPHA